MPEHRGIERRYQFCLELSPFAVANRTIGAETTSLRQFAFQPSTEMQLRSQGSSLAAFHWRYDNIHRVNIRSGGCKRLHDGWAGLGRGFPRAILSDQIRSEQKRIGKDMRGLEIGAEGLHPTHEQVPEMIRTEGIVIPDGSGKELGCVVKVGLKNRKTGGKDAPSFRRARRRWSSFEAKRRSQCLQSGFPASCEADQNLLVGSLVRSVECRRSSNVSILRTQYPAFRDPIFKSVHFINAKDKQRLQVSR